MHDQKRRIVLAHVGDGIRARGLVLVLLHRAAENLLSGEFGVAWLSYPGVVTNIVKSVGP